MKRASSALMQSRCCWSMIMSSILQLMSSCSLQHVHACAASVCVQRVAPSQGEGSMHSRATPACSSTLNGLCCTCTRHAAWCPAAHRGRPLIRRPNAIGASYVLAAGLCTRCCSPVGDALGLEELAVKHVAEGPVTQIVAQPCTHGSAARGRHRGTRWPCGPQRCRPAGCHLTAARGSPPAMVTHLTSFRSMSNCTSTPGHRHPSSRLHGPGRLPQA